MLKGTHTKGMVFARRASRVKKKCRILHSSFHQDVVFSTSFSFILNSSRTTFAMDMRVLQRSQSCCMRICQIHLKSEQESKCLTTLMALFRYFLYVAAHSFYLGVCVTPLLQRRLLSLKQNKLVWVIKPYFSQDTNQQNIFLLSSKSPQKRHIQGILLAASLLLLLLVGGPQGVPKLCGTIVLPGTSAELNTLSRQYWVAPPNRPEVAILNKCNSRGFSIYLGSIWLFSLFVYLKLLSFNSTQKRDY